MMTIKGPGLFLGQFASDEAPFNSWDSITKWAADCGTKGVQVASWATGQVTKAITAARNLGVDQHVSFSGALAWPYVYPWPQSPAGLVEAAFGELAKRWRPIPDHAEEHGVDVCYEIHPGEDLHDGVTFEMFLERVNNHARANMLYDPSHYVLQWLDYLDNIDFDGWAVVEWECAIKHPEDGAREGAAFVGDHIIKVTERAFDDFADGGADYAANRAMSGLNR